MTSTTPRTALPLLAAAQAQKHVTHNDALLQLDALMFARFLDRGLTAPPASPADGDAYLVHATATGDWTAKDGQIAYAVDGAWRFAAPFTGLAAYVVDEAVLIVFNGSAWVDYASILNLQNVPLLGVNTTADATNKFAAKSSAILFDNVGGGMQAKLNKHASGDTASLLYQDNYSGRAEIGLCGDDDFHFKVSPDGSSWTDAMRILGANGHVAVGAAASAAAAVSQFHISQAANAPASTIANSTDTLLLTAENNAALHLVASTNTAGNRFSVIAHRARGNFAGLAPVLLNDKLFGFIGGGYDGAGFQNSALIEFICDATPSTGHVPTRISLTTGTNSTDRLERMTVTSAGLIGIATTPAVQLDVNGPVRVGQYTVATLSLIHI